MRVPPEPARALDLVQEPGPERVLGELVPAQRERLGPLVRPVLGGLPRTSI